MTDERWRHHRLRDHFGYESDLYVTLSEPLGPWPVGTPVHYVIASLLDQITALQSTNHTVLYFTANAVLLGPGGTVRHRQGHSNLSSR